MSTWMYLRCDSHLPPIVSEDEVGQHTSDLPRIRAELAEGLDHQDWESEWNRLAREYHAMSMTEGFDSRLYFRMNTARFMKHHATCNVNILDEYDREYEKEVEDDDDTSPRR